MKRPAIKKNPQPKEDALRTQREADGETGRWSEHDWETFAYACRIEGYVRQNGKKGTALFKAAALFRAIANIEDDVGDDRRLLQFCGELATEWEGLPRGEREALRNGWHDPGRQPTPTQWLRQQEHFADNEVEWGLEMSVTVDGTEVWGFADWNLFHGRTGLQLVFGAGSERDATVKEIRAIADAMEANWGEFIANRGGNQRVTWPVRRASGRGAGVAVSDKPPSGMFPIGSLVKDGDDAGIIVGGFRGKTRTAYCYLDQDGEPNFQFEDGIKPAAGKVGGLPDLVDVHGRDPLAELRGAAPERWAFDTAGRRVAPLGAEPESAAAVRKSAVRKSAVPRKPVATAKAVRSAA